MDNLLLTKQSLEKAHFCGPCQYLGVMKLQHGVLQTALCSSGRLQTPGVTTNKQSEISHLVTSHVQSLSALSFLTLQGIPQKDRRLVRQITDIRFPHVFSCA